ncbi:MAG TPA: glycoside hydrolase family 43 protein [Acidimicrobiales bacterium]|nr:glycoside hydrolase family 43 protein [Acidimicrobiales bacterium]
MRSQALVAAAVVLATAGLVAAGVMSGQRAAGAARSPARVTGAPSSSSTTTVETTTEPPTTVVDTTVVAETTPSTAPPPPPAPRREAAAAPPPPTTAPPPVVKQPPPRPNRVDPGPAPAPAPGSTAVYPDDAPDPFVFHAGSWWYAFTTQHGLSQVPMLRSPDLQHWEAHGDALPRLPQWAEWGYAWAPSVLARPPGYVLYYTTRDAATHLQCLSVATSLLPDGPYVDTSSGPFVCQTDRGGSIDPSPFLDAGGRPWLTWKSEGTVDGEPTRIWSAPLTDDGLHLAGDPHELLTTSLAWEGPIVEGPSMLVDGGSYHLLFSGNRWETSDYAIGHAACAGPAGPCTPDPDPMLGSSATAAGPGGAEVFRGLDGAPMIAYHAWDPSAVGYPAGARRLHIARLTVAGGRVSAA